MGAKVLPVHQSAGAQEFCLLFSHGASCDSFLFSFCEWPTQSWSTLTDCCRYWCVSHSLTSSLSGSPSPSLSSRKSKPAMTATTTPTAGRQARQREWMHEGGLSCLGWRRPRPRRRPRGQSASHPASQLGASRKKGEKRSECARLKTKDSPSQLQTTTFLHSRAGTLTKF